MKIKFITILLAMLFSLSNLYAQASNDIYLEALKLYIKKTSSFDKDLKTIYVQQSNKYVNFPDAVDGVNIIELDFKGIIKLTKKGKFLPIIIIEPLELKDNDLTILVSKYSLTRKRKKWNYASEYGTRVIIKYDCDRGKYTYKII